MIKVKEILPIKDKYTVLVCDPFSDADITSKIRIGEEEITHFHVETPKGCFSPPCTREIVVFCSDIPKVSDLQFI